MGKTIRSKRATNKRRDRAEHVRAVKGTRAKTRAMLRELVKGRDPQTETTPAPARSALS